MKRRVLVLFILIIFSFHGKNACADSFDQATIDSLLQVLSTEKNDSEKVWIYSKIISTHVYFKTDEGVKYIEPALRLAQKINWQGGIFSIKSQAGRLYWRMNQFDKALEYHFDALKIAEGTGKEKKHCFRPDMHRPGLC